MSYDEIQHNKARRLHELKKRQALEGGHTPPEIQIEIADLEASGVRPLLAAAAAPDWFNLYVVVSASGVSASLLIGVLDFILILALRGS